MTFQKKYVFEGNCWRLRLWVSDTIRFFAIITGNPCSRKRQRNFIICVFGRSDFGIFKYIFLIGRTDLPKKPQNRPIWFFSYSEYPFATKELKHISERSEARSAELWSSGIRLGPKMSSKKWGRVLSIYVSIYISKVTLYYLENP